MNEYTLKVHRDPIGEGFALTRAKEIILHPGVTVLVGCNGAGKTTLLHNLKHQVEEEQLPHVLFDNLSEGSSNAISKHMWLGNQDLGINMMLSSEGENIVHNIGHLASTLRNFVDTGQCDMVQSRRLAAAIWGDEYKMPETDKRFLLLDAVDSGLSIDNIVDLDDLFNVMCNDARDKMKELYIVLTANSYELAAKYTAIDVQSGKEVKFCSYDDYRDFILASRAKKMNRKDYNGGNNEKG